MKLFLTIILMLLLGLIANLLSGLFGWVAGFFGVILFNFIFVILPGVVIATKASKAWPNFKVLWSVGFGIIPILLGIAYLIYGDLGFAYSTLIMGLITVVACSLSVKVALSNLQSS